ncbi:MAG: transposase [Planctomycetota bacterium]
MYLRVYRQGDAFARLGVQCSRKTLCYWVRKTAVLQKTVAREIERQIRAGPELEFDDTPVLVKRPEPCGGTQKVCQSYLWTIVNPEVPGVVDGRLKGDPADS